MNKKMYNIIPLTRRQTDLQRFKVFKTTQKCDIQNWRQNQYLTSKKPIKTRNVGHNLSILRKSEVTGTLHYDIVRKLMHQRIFLYPLL